MAILVPLVNKTKQNFRNRIANPSDRPVEFECPNIQLKYADFMY